VINQFDYLTIGHISRDVVPHELSPTGYQVGGTVAFAGRIAHALGCRTAVLTSASADFPAQAAIPECEVRVIESAETTSFSNIYTPNGRVQIVHALASKITAQDVPEDWRNIPIVHLGPITPQIDPQLVCTFPNSLIGITPQGWMREWGEDGRVRPIPLQHADLLLPNADAVIIGEEDLVNADDLSMMRTLSKLLVVTRSARGCTLFFDDQAIDVPAPQTVERNPTGAGDTFATAFFYRLWRTAGDMVSSAEFANKIAAATVAQPDLPEKIMIVNQIMAEEHA
jgi:sugar/nucleoside kinase (ribokinase family)